MCGGIFGGIEIADCVLWRGRAEDCTRIGIQFPDFIPSAGCGESREGNSAFNKRMILESENH
jgi:hypothetical protein